MADAVGCSASYLLGGAAEVLFKRAVKVLGVRITKLIGDFRHSLAAAQQQVARSFQPLRLHKLADAAPKELPETTLQAELVELAGAGQLRQGGRLARLLLQQGPRVVQLVALGGAERQPGRPTGLPLRTLLGHQFRHHGLVVQVLETGGAGLCQGVSSR